jgi:hypothetical protein
MTITTEAVIFSLPLITPLSPGVLEGRGENGELVGVYTGVLLGVNEPSGDCEGEGEASEGVLAAGLSELLGVPLGLEEEGVEP